MTMTVSKLMMIDVCFELGRFLVSGERNPGARQGIALFRDRHTSIVSRPTCIHQKCRTNINYICFNINIFHGLCTVPHPEIFETMKSTA